MAGTEVATGYVTLYPKMSSDFKTSVESGVSSAGSSSSKTFGSSFTSGLSSVGVAAGNLISSAISTAVGAVSSSLDSAISRVDTLNQFPKVMSNLGFSTEDADAALSKLSDGIQGLPTALDEIVGNTQTLSLTLGDLSKGTDVALALNDGMLTYGASSSQVSNAVYQLNQMISAGSYDLESWRSVIESAPGYMDQVAESCLGAGSSANDLREALNDGTVTTDQFLDAIVTLDQEGSDSVVAFSEQAKTATGGIATSFTNVKTAVTKNLANFIDAVNGTDGNISKIADSMKQVVNDIGSAFEPLGEKVGEAVGQIADNFDSAWASVKELAGNVWSQVEEPIETAFEALGEIDMSGLLDSAGGLADIFGDTLTTGIKTICEDVIPNAVESFNTLKDAAGDVKDKLDELLHLVTGGSNVFTAIGESCESLVKTLATLLSTLSYEITSISKFLTGDFEGAAEYAMKTAEVFTGGMSSALGDLGNAYYDIVGLDWDAATQGFATSSEYVEALAVNVEDMTGRCEAFQAAAANIDATNLVGLRYELEQVGWSGDEATEFMAQFAQAVDDGGQSIINLDPSKITDLGTAVSSLSGDNVTYLAEALGYVVQSTDSANSGLSSMSYSAEQVAAAAQNASDTVSAAASSMSSAASSTAELASSTDAAASNLDATTGSAQGAADTISSAMGAAQSSVSLTADEFAALLQGGTNLDGAMVQLYDDSGNTVVGLTEIGTGASQSAGQFDSMRTAIDGASGSLSALLQYNGQTVTVNVVTAYSTTGTATSAAQSATFTHAVGGVTNGVHIIGEAGPEAIVPLYAGAMDPFAKQVADFIDKDSGGGTVYNLFINDAQVNGDAAIKSHVLDLFADLDRIGAI